MSLHIPEEKYENAVISAEGSTVILKGEVEQSQPEHFLEPFFDKVISQMGDIIEIDITELDYLNSSGIKCLVKFILQKKPDSKIIFKTDKYKFWQQTSMNVIKTLDEENITFTLSE